jgi:hypothetical protein
MECKDTDSFFPNYVPPNNNDVTPDMEGQGQNRRRSVREYWYSDDIIDHEDRSFFVDANDAQHAFNRIRSRRSLKTLMSKDNATRFCQQIIEESTAGKTCINITIAMLQCVTDLQVSLLDTTTNTCFYYPVLI